MVTALGSCVKWPLAASKLNSQWDRQWCAFLLESLQSHFWLGEQPHAYPILFVFLIHPLQSSLPSLWVRLYMLPPPFHALPPNNLQSFQVRFKLLATWRVHCKTKPSSSHLWCVSIPLLLQVPFPWKSKNLLQAPGYLQNHSLVSLLLLMFEFPRLRICCIGCCLWGACKRLTLLSSGAYRCCNFHVYMGACKRHTTYRVVTLDTCKRLTQLSSGSYWCCNSHVYMGACKRHTFIG